MKYKYYKFTENRSIKDAEINFKQRITGGGYIHSKYHKNFITRNCPICGSKQYDRYDKFIGLYNIDKCKICNSIFVNPIPDINALYDYYNNCECNKFLSNIIKKRFDSNDFINDERVKAITDTIKKSENFNKSTISILEIGCNNGALLSKLKHALNFNNIKFELHGIDADLNAINNSLDNDLNLMCGFIENIADDIKYQENYDYIIHFELLEHLSDPINFIQSIHKMLKTNAKMIFTTPNILGLDNQALNYNSKRYLAHSIFPPMHLNAFSTQNIGYFLMSNSFAIEDISTPGRLDLDMITLCKNELKEELFKDIALCPNDIKAILQELLRRLNSSGHMQCIARKI